MKQLSKSTDYPDNEENLENRALLRVVNRNHNDKIRNLNILI